MGHGNNRDAAIEFAKDYLKRKMPHKVITMPGIAHWKSIRIRGYGFQRLPELSLKSVGCLSAALRIPA